MHACQEFNNDCCDGHCCHGALLVFKGRKQSRAMLRLDGDAVALFSNEQYHIHPEVPRLSGGRNHDHAIKAPQIAASRLSLLCKVCMLKRRINVYRIESGRRLPMHLPVNATQTTLKFLIIYLPRPAASLWGIFPLVCLVWSHLRHGQQLDLRTRNALPGSWTLETTYG